MDATASQTLGPFLNRALLGPGSNDIAAGAAGAAIEIGGRVLAAPGDPVRDALVELWQADGEGHFAHPADRRGAAGGFRGFARTITAADGSFRFRTIKPGRVPGDGNRWQAPHINVSVFAAGLLQRAVTRLYFPGDPANDGDPLLCGIADDEARAALIAAEDGPGRLRFDIVLRGEGASQFFTL